MEYRSKILRTEELNALNIKISHVRCKGCENNCLLTINTFENGKKFENGSNIEAAKQVGELVAKRALEAGITTVVFDRGGFIFHGRVKALADAAREAGLKF